MAAATKETNDRNDQLDLWLDRVNAGYMWSAKIPAGNGAKVEAYNINGQCTLILRFADRDGWELFVPSSKLNNVAASLDGAAEVLGVEGCRGLVG